MSLPQPTYRPVLNKIFLLSCCCLCQCVQTYISPYKSPPTGYLVVEGFISIGAQTRFSISRTIGLPGDSAIPAVTGASVLVEGSDGAVYPLPEQDAGVYGDTLLPLNPALLYRLRIHTAEGQDYLSDFVTCKASPPIDSVNWIYDYRNTNGVNIFVNTHDPNNGTHFYQWDYQATWVYYSPEESFYVYDTADNTVVPRRPDQFNYVCWNSIKNKDLLIDNTTKLAQDVVYEYPLINVPYNSIEISSLYSIQVTQYALTREAYNFLLQMQQNTESLGGVFDVQPTQLAGNIHSLTNPGEQVIGFVSAGTVQQQRIFIAESQLPYWEYDFQCETPNYLVPDVPDSLKFYFRNNGWMPLEGVPGGYTANQAFCIDCTFRGGTTQRPPFWPN